VPAGGGGDPDRGVHVRAREVPESHDHDRDDQPERRGDAADAERASGQVVRRHGPRPGTDEAERPDRLRDEAARQAGGRERCEGHAAG
jgi:hypothetical protein